MNWREWIIEGRKKKSELENASATRPVFTEGATVERVNRLEKELGLPLPFALRELLVQTDGVDLEMYCENEWLVFHVIVWTCDEIAQENRLLRSSKDAPKAPNDDLTPLFFANPAVDGILLAFFIHRSGVEDPGVYAYYPIETAWRLVSPSLEANVLGYDL